MKLIKITLETKKRFKNSDAEKLRGFFGNYFRENIMFHNHKTDFIIKQILNLIMIFLLFNIK